MARASVGQRCRDQALLSAFASLDYIVERLYHFLAHPVRCVGSVAITSCVRGHRSAWAQGSWVTCV